MKTVKTTKRNINIKAATNIVAKRGQVLTVEGAQD